MSRFTDELALVRNVIDYDPAANDTPAGLVELWANHVVDKNNDALTPSFVASPVAYMINRLRKALASSILRDLESETGVPAMAYARMAFVGYCAAKFDEGSGVFANAPNTLVRAEMLHVVNNLVELLEDNSGDSYAG